MKAIFKIYDALIQVSYYLYLESSVERSELVDSRVRKSNPILQLVTLARAALANAYASLTAFCLHTIVYYIA